MYKRQELGEIEYENFNAAAAEVTVHGVNVHPGSAKGKMKNAEMCIRDSGSALQWTKAAARL